jgi:hypothetical protein
LRRRGSKTSCQWAYGNLRFSLLNILGAVITFECGQTYLWSVADGA